MSYGLHIIQYPTGRFGYVGTVPSALGEAVPASYADVMGGRSFWNADKSALLTIKWPRFETKAEAVEFAKSKGYEVR